MAKIANETSTESKIDRVINSAKEVFPHRGELSAALRGLLPMPLTAGCLLRNSSLPKREYGGRYLPMEEVREPESLHRKSCEIRLPNRASTARHSIGLFYIRRIRSDGTDN